MSDIVSAFCVGINQTLIGHPFDTIKVLMQNNRKFTGLSIKDYYRGWKFPLTTSILFNCTVFPVYERSLKYTNSVFISSGMAGLVVTPVVFLSECGMLRQQTKQPISLQILLKSRGIYPVLFREVIATTVYFSSYNYAKNELKLNPLISGGIAGITNWTLTYPFDIIKSRQIVQNMTIKQAFKMGNLWRGYPICALRAIVVNSVNFWTYENVKGRIDSF